MFNFRTFFRSFDKMQQKKQLRHVRFTQRSIDQVAPWSGTTCRMNGVSCEKKDNFLF